MRASGYATRNFNKQTCGYGKAAADRGAESGLASKPSNWHPGAGGKDDDDGQPGGWGDRDRDEPAVADCC